MVNIPSDKWLGPSANKTLGSFLTIVNWCLTLIKLYKTFHPQAVAKMRPVSGWREEVTRVWQFPQLWNSVWYDLTRRLNRYWFNRKLGVVFMFIQTPFIILSMVDNQAVKQENWPDKVTCVTLTSDQWPGPGEGREDSSPVSGTQEDRADTDL